MGIRWVVVRLRVQEGGHAHALGAVSIYNSRWRAPSLKFNVVRVEYILHTLYFSCNFSSTSLFNDFDSTDASFHQMLPIGVLALIKQLMMVANGSVGKGHVVLLGVFDFHLELSIPQ